MHTIFRLVIMTFILCLNSNNTQAQKIENQYDGIERTQIVDLGLSVKWAGWNIGAKAPEEKGGLYGWADAQGEKTSKKLKDYPDKVPPTNIMGDAKYDIARARWGYPFRLPSYAEAIELINNCKWEVVRYCGVYGYKVTGPNGKAIFLPNTGHRIGSTIKTADDGPLSGEHGNYAGNLWTGILSSKNGKCAYYISFEFTNKHETAHNQNISLLEEERYIGFSVRAVSE